MKTKQIKTIQYSDPVLETDYTLKIANKNGELEVQLPLEKNFFRGVSFTEKVKLKKLKNGKWVKTLRAKFGAGAEELFGLTELNEESELEARDVRIIAKVEEFFAKSKSKNAHSRA